jgi:hypothetical protein
MAIFAERLIGNWGCRAKSGARRAETSRIGSPVTPGCLRTELNSDGRAVELGERKSVEGLVIRRPLIAQDTDGDGFP